MVAGARCSCRRCVPSLGGTLTRGKRLRTFFLFGKKGFFYDVLFNFPLFPGDGFKLTPRL